jgi:hypothetical protein
VSKRDEILGALRSANLAVREGCDARAERFVDMAMKLLHGDDYVEGALTYAELNDACEAFLKKTGFLSLSSLLIHIEHWQKEEKQSDGEPKR